MPAKKKTEEVRLIREFKPERNAPVTGSLKVEDVLESFRKRKNRSEAATTSVREAKRRERDIAAMMREAWNIQAVRAPESGAFGTRMGLDDTTKALMIGDLSIPFALFTTEVKRGYDFDLAMLFGPKDKRGSMGPWKQIEDFVDQAAKEARKAKRWPLVVWAQINKPYLAIVSREIFAQFLVQGHLPSGIVHMHLGTHVIIAFEEFLKIPRSALFTQ